MLTQSDKGDCSKIEHPHQFGPLRTQFVLHEGIIGTQFYSSEKSGLRKTGEFSFHFTIKSHNFTETFVLKLGKS
jgi:hypothetical protein